MAEFQPDQTSLTLRELSELQAAIARTNPLQWRLETRAGLPLDLHNPKTGTREDKVPHNLREIIIPLSPGRELGLMTFERVDDPRRELFGIFESMFTGTGSRSMESLFRQS